MAASRYVFTIAALVLLLLTSGLSTADFTPQLRQMVTFVTNKLASDYEFYGCWCNSANLADLKVTPYVDESDRCCRLHHECLGAVSMSCTPNTTEYDSIFRKGKISCLDSENSCEYSICQCDKLMAECLQKFLNTFNGSKFQNVAKERCQASQNSTTPSCSSRPTLCETSTWDQTPIIVAGDGTKGNGTNQLYSTYDMTLDSKGNLYVADTSDPRNGRIRKYFANNSNPPITLFTSTDNQFRGGIFEGPINNIFVDKHDNVYFTVFAAVKMISSTTGVVTTVAGNDTYGSALNQLARPVGLYIDQAGTIYVSDSQNNRVMKYLRGSTQGVVIAGGIGPGNSSSALSYPYGIFIDEINEKGAMYIVDASNDRVQKYLIGATTGVTVASGLYSPRVIIVDTNRIMYWSSNSNSIIRYVPNGSGRPIVGGITSGAVGIKFDSDYNLYVADINGYRILKYLYQPSSCLSKT